MALLVVLVLVAEPAARALAAATAGNVPAALLVVLAAVDRVLVAEVLLVVAAEAVLVVAEAVRVVPVAVVPRSGRGVVVATAKSSSQ